MELRRQLERPSARLFPLGNDGEFRQALADFSIAHADQNEKEEEKRPEFKVCKFTAEAIVAEGIDKVSPIKTPLSTRCAFIADRMRSTKRYSNNRSLAVWRLGNSEKASENKSCRVGPSSGRGVERKHEWFRKRRDERIQHSGAKFDRCAYEFGTLFIWAVKTMETRTWKKQDAWCINHDLASIWPVDLQPSFLEHMKMTGMFAFLIPRASAQEPRVKHPSR